MIPDPAPAPRSSRWLFIALSLLVLILGLRVFVAEPVRVHENSMSPTLHDGDALIIDKWSFHFRDPRVGDIVVARIPDSGRSIVKRVVAVGGDTIGIDDGHLVRNGTIVSEPYADNDQMKGYFWGPITLPRGEVFLLGDNRLESVDSRNFGPLPLADIDGRLLVRVWPL